MQAQFFCGGGFLHFPHRMDCVRNAPKCFGEKEKCKKKKGNGAIAFIGVRRRAWVASGWGSRLPGPSVRFPIFRDPIIVIVGSAVEMEGKGTNIKKSDPTSSTHPIRLPGDKHRNVLLHSRYDFAPVVLYWKNGALFRYHALPLLKGLVFCLSLCISPYLSLFLTCVPAGRAYGEDQDFIWCANEMNRTVMRSLQLRKENAFWR